MYTQNWPKIEFSDILSVENKGYFETSTFSQIAPNLVHFQEIFGIVLSLKWDFLPTLNAT